MKQSCQFASQRGGAALEYVIVSTVSALLALAAMTYVGQKAQDQLEKLNAALEEEMEKSWGDDI